MTVLTIGRSVTSLGGSSSGSGTHRVKRTAAGSVLKPLLTEAQTLPLPVGVGLFEITAEHADGTPIKRTFTLKAAP